MILDAEIWIFAVSPSVFDSFKTENLILRVWSAMMACPMDCIWTYNFLAKLYINIVY